MAHTIAFTSVPAPFFSVNLKMPPITFWQIYYEMIHD
jgi:hypothetical protein